MEFIENLKETLLDSLQYPEYARAEFLLKKQIESGWSKNVFLLALKEICTKYNHLLILEKLQAEKDNPSLNKSEIGLSLEKETNGKIKEVSVENRKKSELLNNEVLELLLIAVDEAYNFNDLEPKYSDLQIITHFENVVHFIRHEFELQTEVKEDDMPFGRPTPKGFTGKTEKGEKIFVLYDYYTKWPKPVLDFSIFKHSLRNLMLNSQNPEKLSIMLKPIVEEVKAIVKIWNKKIQPLTSGIGKSITYRKLIEFKSNMADWTVYMDEEDFPKFRRNATRYTNYQLARFAYDAGSLIADEILEPDNTGGTIPKITDVKPSVASYAIMHVYWGKYDETKAITKTNKQLFADKYGISSITLFSEYGNYIDKRSRQGLPAGKERKNAVTPYIKRFEDAATMLKEIHPKAYNDALIELNEIKNKYADYLI